MKKKKQIMTAALLSAFCMSVTGCSLYQGNKDRQPVNASQAETDTKEEIKQQPSGKSEEETKKPTDAHPEDIEPFPHGEKETQAQPMKNGKRIVLMTDIHYLADSLTREQAVLLQKNSSILLALYALADMGIHYDGWNRMDTVKFFKEYGVGSAEIVNQIYDLIIGSPGNYLKYYIGYVEFLELKKKWVEKKGENFSQKEFHKAVLDVGPAPFELVEKYMWQGEK